MVEEQRAAPSMQDSKCYLEEENVAHQMPVIKELRDLQQSHNRPSQV